MKKLLCVLPFILGVGACEKSPKDISSKLDSVLEQVCDSVGDVYTNYIDFIGDSWNKREHKVKVYEAVVSAKVCIMPDDNDIVFVTYSSKDSLELMKMIIEETVSFEDIVYKGEGFIVADGSESRFNVMRTNQSSNILFMGTMRKKYAGAGYSEDTMNKLKQLDKALLKL